MPTDTSKKAQNEPKKCSMPAEHAVTGQNSGFTLIFTPGNQPAGERHQRVFTG